MKLQGIKNGLIKIAGRKGLLLKKHSPEILMVAGVVGVVTSTVLACKATLKIDEVLEETRNNIDKIKFANETMSKEKYSDNDYKKDMAVTYVQATVKLAKLYGPSILIGAASIGCILGAHGIMRKRNFALVAAYKAVEKGFADYRKRVVDELGVDKDRHFNYGTEKAIIKGFDEDGKKIKNEVESLDNANASVYARFFDESCQAWSKSSEYNLTFLKCQQNYANDMLNLRGHVFLNEVYDMLGLPRTQAGAVVGWVKDVGDSFIDFGVFEGNTSQARAFVNGYERSILLDFNVDGVIYDKL